MTDAIDVACGVFVVTLFAALSLFVMIYIAGLIRSLIYWVD